jgi:hypothetical protein|tara:strand:+ start:649 stop:828 length:180 start_codon:yes stop_codon:yes gene_type:complete
MNNLITEKELAKNLSISVFKLQKDRSRKTGLPYVRIGKIIRYDPIQVAKSFKEVNLNKT